MIFSKWIWIIPLFIFFLTLIYGTVFYETPIIREVVEGCVEQYNASTRICP
jgi:hypothetical protein|tara:strand:- start:1238 stop:1390 length:153 start_codon:yes stop_codon:yes gene_type:complete